MRNRREHLRCTNVRSAKHSYLAIGIGQGGRPLHRVVAIIGFVFEGVPLAFRGIATANILKDDHKSARCSPNPKDQTVAFVIWCALQQDGKLSFGLRPINISSENNAVAHLRRDSMLGRHFKRFDRVNGARAQGQAKCCREQQNSLKARSSRIGADHIASTQKFCHDAVTLSLTLANTT